MPGKYPKSMDMLREIEKEQKCLFDDMMFASAAYTRPEIIDDIVRRVFTKAGIPVSRIDRTEIQKRLLSADAKEIVLDCYAETEDGIRMAVEVQNEASGFSHKRAAFYSARLRVQEDKGTDYDGMMPVYLIILHRHDPYRKSGNNLPIYVKGCYIKNTDMVYNDGMNVIRVNGDYMERGDIIGDLMRAMKATRPEDTDIELYRETIRSAKENGMKYTLEDLLAASRDEGIEKGIEIGKNEGKAEGKAEGIAEVLANLQKLGISEDIIRKAIPAGN